jgi:hypothetical protein
MTRIHIDFVVISYVHHLEVIKLGDLRVFMVTAECYVEDLNAAVRVHGLVRPVSEFLGLRATSPELTFTTQLEQSRHHPYFAIYQKQTPVHCHQHNPPLGSRSSSILGAGVESPLNISSHPTSRPHDSNNCFTSSTTSPYQTAPIAHHIGTLTALDEEAVGTPRITEAHQDVEDPILIRLSFPVFLSQAGHQLHANCGVLGFVTLLPLREHLPMRPCEEGRKRGLFQPIIHQRNARKVPCWGRDVPVDVNYNTQSSDLCQLVLVVAIDELIAPIQASSTAGRIVHTFGQTFFFLLLHFLHFFKSDL